MLNGEQLKRVRELRGISQSMLANYLGITNRYIIYCEQGVYEPAEDLYERWINALYCNEIYNASKIKKLNNNFKITYTNYLTLPKILQRYFALF